MTVPRLIDGFFFRRIPATMFGVMRMAWGSVTALYLLFQWNDVAYYYSERGIMPHRLEDIFTRQEWRFTILDYVDQPLAVHCLYIILIILLVCTAAGIKTRISTVLAALLLFSFHERNPNILGGGDTLLRCIGFILMIAPGIQAFSLERAAKGWHSWKKTRQRLPPATMPIWPWRLLLWQMIVLYSTSFWTKMLGTMWIDGTAVHVTLHHPLFSRVPMWFVDSVMPMSVWPDRFILFWQAAWLLFLVPLPARIPFRRIMLAIGIPFHLAIYLMMDAGSFSLAVFTAYLGLLREDDVAWLKKTATNYKRQTTNSIVVLFDGHCGLCLRSTYILELCDWLNVLKPVDFRVADDRRAFAPDVTERNLDKAMHIKLPSGTYLTGFDAFRYLAKRLPPFWLLWPILWIPGVAPVGRAVYAGIAARRKRCTHENCMI